VVHWFELWGLFELRILDFELLLMGFYIKDAREVERMRQAGAIASRTLDLMAVKVKPGVTLKELERWCREYIESQNGKPAFLGYRGFPGAVCISVNDEVVHGIPSKRRVKAGDLVKVDVGVILDGLYADTARTFVVGEIPPRTRQLVMATEQALALGIAQARAGNRLSDISCAVQDYVEALGFSVVRELSGHGVGIKLHEEPSVPNFGKPGTGSRLVAGLTIAIEPMINQGTYEVRTERNGWTVVTKDGAPSAHFEHTILVNDGPAEILTK
jgi:methionyl aminopeptidase